MNAPHPSRPSRLRRFVRAALALAVVGAPLGGCVIVDNGNGAPPYSAEDTAVAPPNAPAIDAYYTDVFSGVPCTPNGPGGITTWQITTDSGQDSGIVSCWDPNQNADFMVMFPNLAGDAVYNLTATGYTYDGQGCYSVTCSAHTMPGPHAVLPDCSYVTKSC